MVGYRVTEKGLGLLDAYVTGAEFVWVPGVNYDRLEKMALVLNKALFGTKEGYFAVSSDYAEEWDLLAIKALEMDGYIERSVVPKVERFLAKELFKSNHPGYFPLLGTGEGEI